MSAEYKSFTVKELKEWVNSIPAQMDFEQVTYLEYDGMNEPCMDIGFMFKRGLKQKCKC